MSNDQQREDTHVSSTYLRARGAQPRRVNNGGVMSITGRFAFVEKEYTDEGAAGIAN